MLKSALIAVLALPTLAFGQSLDMQVDYSTTGQSVNAVLADLSAKTGVAFKADGILGNLVLTADVKGVTAKDLAEKIAYATGGAWENRNGTYVLTQNNYAQTEAEKIAQALTQATIEKYAADLRADENFKPQRDYKAELSAFLANQDQRNASIVSPLQVLPQVLVTELPSSTFALPPLRRKVYSDRPTKMQTSMPAEMRRLVDRTLKTYEECLLIAQRELQKAAQENRRVRVPHQFGGDINAVNRYLEAVRGTAKTNVIVWRGEEGMEINIMCLDGQGNTLLKFGNFITDRPVTAANINVRIDFDGAGAFDEKQQTIFDFYGTSVRNQVFNRRDQVVTSESVGLPFSGSVTPKQLGSVLDPTTHDPVVELIAKPLYATYSGKGNFVGVVPDSLVRHAGATMDKAQFAAAVQQSTDWKVETSGGWTVVLPTSPYHAWGRSVDRTALKTLIEASANNFGLTSLPALTDYALQAPEDVMVTTWDGLLMSGLFGSPAGSGVSSVRYNRHAFLINHFDGKTTGPVAYRTLRTETKHTWHDRVFNYREGIALNGGRGTVLSQGRPGEFAISDALSSFASGTPITMQLGDGQAVTIVAALSSGDAGMVVDSVRIDGQDVTTTFQVAFEEAIAGDPVMMTSAPMMAGGGAFNPHMSTFQVGGQQNLGPEERTDRYPNGLPIGGEFQANRSESHLFMGIDANGKTRQYSPQSYASELFRMKYPTPGQATVSPDKYTRFVLIRQDNVNFMLRPDTYGRVLYNINGATVISEPRGFDNLPAEIRQQVQQTFDRLEKSYMDRLNQGGNQGRNNGGGGNGRIPPQP